MPTPITDYASLGTMDQWQAAAIEKALEGAIERGLIHREHGQNTLEEFRRCSGPKGVIRFSGQS